MISPEIKQAFQCTGNTFRHWISINIQFNMINHSWDSWRNNSLVIFQMTYCKPSILSLFKHSTGLRKNKSLVDYLIKFTFFFKSIQSNLPKAACCSAAWDHAKDEWSKYSYCKTSNISRTLVGNKIVDNSDVVGASPVGAAPTTSSFSTWHLASMD